MFVAGALEHERPFLGPLTPGTRCEKYLLTLSSYCDASPPKSRNNGTTHAARGLPRQIAVRELTRRPAQPALESEVGSQLLIEKES